MNVTTANGTDMNETNRKSFNPQLIDNAYLGMFIFISAELMFFSGLMGMFLFLRFGGTVWPPPDQPMLPIFVTAINTVILLTSGYLMVKAWTEAVKDNYTGMLAALIASGVTGLTFVLIQGYEWIQLIGFGLTLSSSVYGASFYMLIGAHALHVFAASIWLIVVIIRAVMRRKTNRNVSFIKPCAIYWFFVVALWPLLFIMVYLI